MLMKIVALAIVADGQAAQALARNVPPPELLALNIALVSRHGKSPLKKLSRLTKSASTQFTGRIQLGYVPTSKVGAELLFDVISTAYERTSIVLTTNLPFEQWTEVLGSERLVGATLDRLTHRCHILEAKGESYRLKDAKRQRRTESSKNRKSPTEESAKAI
jgi:hypothetical protein